MDDLGRYVEWCRSVLKWECGLGTPWEPMKLVGGLTHPRLVTIETGKDLTRAFDTLAVRRVRELEAVDLSGYVFKASSPSCGIEEVALYDRRGMMSRKGVGLFARTFMEHCPLIPVVDESKLDDPAVHENFLERVYCYRRWRNLLHGHPTRQAVVDFHTVHKSLLLPHSREDAQRLGRLVTNANRYSPPDLAQRHGQLFMETLTVKATAKKHVHGLQRLVGPMQDLLGSDEKEELHSVLAD